MKKSKKIGLSLNKKVVSNLKTGNLTGGSTACHTGMWCPENGNFTIGCTIQSRGNQGCGGGSIASFCCNEQ